MEQPAFGWGLGSFDKIFQLVRPRPLSRPIASTSTATSTPTPTGCSPATRKWVLGRYSARRVVRTASAPIIAGRPRSRIPCRLICSPVAASFFVRVGGVPVWQSGGGDCLLVLFLFRRAALPAASAAMPDSVPVRRPRHEFALPHFHPHPRQKRTGQSPEACIESARFAGEIVVVDSGSTDGTREIAESLGAQVIDFKWNGQLPKKKNWALAHVAWRYEWVFILDADERITPALATELQQVVAAPACNGYYVNRRFWFLDGWLRHCGYYPSWNLRFFRHALGRYEELAGGGDTGSGDNEVHEHVVLTGAKLATCGAEMDHYAFPAIDVWVEKHNRYSNWEARQLVGGTGATSATLDPGSRPQTAPLAPRFPSPVSPLLRFFYHYVVRAGFLDGYRGFVFCRLMAFYEIPQRRESRRTAAKSRLMTVMRDASPLPPRAIFLNRFGWPEEPATAQLLADLSASLAAAGSEVTVIASRPTGIGGHPPARNARGRDRPARARHPLGPVRNAGQGGGFSDVPFSRLAATRLRRAARRRGGGHDRSAAAWHRRVACCPAVWRANFPLGSGCLSGNRPEPDRPSLAASRPAAAQSRVAEIGWLRDPWLRHGRNPRPSRRGCGENHSFTKLGAGRAHGPAACSPPTPSAPPGTSRASSS